MGGFLVGGWGVLGAVGFDEDEAVGGVVLLEDVEPGDAWFLEAGLGVFEGGGEEGVDGFGLHLDVDLDDKHRDGARLSREHLEDGGEVNDVWRGFETADGLERKRQRQLGCEPSEGREGGVGLRGEAAECLAAEGGGSRGRRVGLGWGWLGVVLAGAMVWELAGEGPLTLAELQQARGLTSRKFAGYFGEFTYTYREALQPPDVFLGRRDGDCDDYAVVADLVLPRHGLTTRLVHVRLAGLVAHVVCFVMEDRLYLDYNNRVYLVKTEKSAPNLREVAGKVAKSFSANWTSASEFTYSNGVKRVVRTVAKVDRPSPETDSLSPPRKKG